MPRRRLWLCGLAPPWRHALSALLLAKAAPTACAVTSVCPLPWNANATLPGGVDVSKKCPYGYRIPKFDVTVPEGASWVEKLCVVYGVVPFAVVGFAVIDCLFHAICLRGIGTRETSFIGFIIFITLVNEFIFKKLARQARPVESCNFSCGFPSGHSTMSVGFFFLMFLDASYRILPKSPLSLESARQKVDSMRGKRTIFGMTLRELVPGDLRMWATIIPLSASDTLSAFDFVSFASFWGVALLPVPLSRVVLHDHTPGQVFIGGAIGIIEAVVWFTVMRYCVTLRWNHHLGKRLAYVFVHNLPLPRFEVVSRCYCLLAQAEESVNQDLLRDLKRACSELSWYLQELEHDMDWLSFTEDRIFSESEKNLLLEMRDEIQIILEKSFARRWDLSSSEDSEGA